MQFRSDQEGIVMRFASVDDLPNTLSQREQLTRGCVEWVARHLPVGLPPSARRSALRNVQSGLNPEFWRNLILKYQTSELTEADLQELRFRLFRNACCEAAQTVAAHEGMAEVDRFRYHPWRTENGRDLYKENLEYEFNTIYDMRKLWFEFQLQLERTALPERMVAEQAKYYEDCLNRRFRVPHWGWDPGTFTFVEISDSKPVDSRGDEQPNKDTLRGLLDRYER